MDDKTRNAMGVDEKGRLHGVPAVNKLVHAARQEAVQLLQEHAKETWASLPETVSYNRWMEADAAVDGESEVEIKEAALRRFLALHLFSLDEEHPQVAARNLRVGDVILAFGCRATVTALHHPDLQGVGIEFDTYPSVMNLDRDVHLPLLARPKS